jgi:DNA-binding transcriptional ArsR family regulator
VHAFDVLGDPVRRRLLTLLADGERSSGELAEIIGAEFGISHPAVSQHLKVLRDAGFTSVRAVGQRRLYAVEPGPLEEVDAWVAQFRHFWNHRLDALGTELRRGARGASGRRGGAPPSDSPDRARRRTP